MSSDPALHARIEFIYTSLFRPREFFIGKSGKVYCTNFAGLKKVLLNLRNKKLFSVKWSIQNRVLLPKYNKEFEDESESANEE